MSEKQLVMNKRWYSFGNPFKVKFRTHRCYKCGAKLSVVKHRKVVAPQSEEAKYYDFNIGATGGIMVGSCEFIHKVFHCPECSENIEFVTQISLEDVDIAVEKIKKYFGKRGRDLSISKSFRMKDKTTLDSCQNIEDVESLILSVTEKGKDDFIYKVPLCRKIVWERPYYFDISAGEIIKILKGKWYT